MATEVPSQYLPLFDVENVVIYPNVTLSVMYFAYGLYALLFGLCIYVLRRGPAFHLQNFYMSVTAILFVVSTCMVAAETTQRIKDTVVLFNSTKTRDFLPFLKFATHNTLKTVMDAFHYLLPIHRCYIVWRNSKRVLVPLVLASFAVNAVSTTGAIMIIIGARDTRIASSRVLFEDGQTITAVGLIMSALFHLVFTLLTGNPLTYLRTPEAGRIWWISRTVQRSKAGWSLNQKHRTVIRIMLVIFCRFDIRLTFQLP
ncbi:hypothetical protein L218DRAFT_873827 [Marasmius fiardii PR-910]|nr:hypothetical protein L218DRAFT_873827 [Marasmius fiardii PR-910]